MRPLQNQSNKWFWQPEKQQEANGPADDLSLEHTAEYIANYSNRRKLHKNNTRFSMFFFMRETWGKREGYDFQKKIW